MRARCWIFCLLCCCWFRCMVLPERRRPAWRTGDGGGETPEVMTVSSPPTASDIGSVVKEQQWEEAPVHQNDDGWTRANFIHYLFHLGKYHLYHWNNIGYTFIAFFDDMNVTGEYSRDFVLIMLPISRIHRGRRDNKVEDYHSLPPAFL